MFASQTPNFAAKEKLEIVIGAAPPPFRPPSGGFAGGFFRKNVFGLIQEYCIITSAKFSAGHARLPPSPPIVGEGGQAKSCGRKPMRVGLPPPAPIHNKLRVSTTIYGGQKN
ncbi:MAG: hypothetical protein UY71_C0018G0014 [Parcubacteria group bacterium GW2011_GWB1_52_7]|nr:MAG: hypothetical protein UY64_C0035G0012 [Parcubacteria group bacterium GW2011_GWA1_51_12]KKW28582.1 MAG: hypothetical protein UY71_C0018G0014 [Parcubacteria group bacterium GW2011_GWB1_52_7]